MHFLHHQLCFGRHEENWRASSVTKVVKYSTQTVLYLFYLCQAVASAIDYDLFCKDMASRKGYITKFSPKHEMFFKTMVSFFIVQKLLFEAQLLFWFMEGWIHLVSWLE